jgi:hypothetical protein
MLLSLSKWGENKNFFFPPSGIEDTYETKLLICDRLELGKTQQCGLFLTNEHWVLCCVDVGNVLSVIISALMMWKD